MSMMNVRPGLRDSQDEAPTFYCDKCMREVYAGGPVFERNGKLLCESCFSGREPRWN